MLREIIASWMESVDEHGGPIPDNLKSPVYKKPSAELVRETEKLILSAYVLGMDHAAVPLDLADEGDYTAIPFDEAIKFMKARIPLTKTEWKALEKEVRFRAFTVAALSTPDAIERVRKAAIAAVEDGMTLSEFWTTAAAENTAGLGESPWYWENVYRTNVQTAYNAGRAAEFQKSQPEYLTLIGINDVRQTDICRSLTEPPIVLPASHPFWQTHWPPFHFGCRTTVRAVFREEVSALREENPEWTITDEGRLNETIPPASGFGGNPIDTGSFYKLTPGMIERAEKYNLTNEIINFGKLLNLRYNPIDLSATANKAGIISRAMDIPGSAEGRTSIRKESKNILNQYRNEVYTNKELNESVILGKIGIEHAVSFAGDPVKLAALEKIPEIIENASGFVSEPELHGDPNFSEILRGKSVVTINGKRNFFAVILKRRKNNGALIFYDIVPWDSK